MSRIMFADDVPKELIEIAKKIDFSKVSPAQQRIYLEQLNTLACKYLPKRVGQVPQNRIKTIEIQGCPQDLATLVSSFDFSKVSLITKKLAIPIIKSWLKNNNLLKQ